VLVAVGFLALGAAALLAVREVRSTRSAAPPRGPGPLAPLVPWLGSLLTVVLAVRGALLAAGLVLFGTVVLAVRTRWRVGRSGPRGGRSAPHRR
jgi:hypothetical protein